MNQQAFLITIILGTIVSLAASWKFSRRGIHPRFHPPLGVVLMVFLGLMGCFAFLAFVIGRMVGNPLPPVGPAPAAEKTNSPEILSNPAKSDGTEIRE
jgi:hypothetical protein